MYAFLVLENFFHPEIDEFQFKLLQVEVGGGDAEIAGVVEHEFHRTGGAQVAVAFIEVRTDIGHGAGVVVGGRFDQNSYAVSGVPFEQYFFEIAL